MTSNTHGQSAGPVLHVLLMEVTSERYDQILSEAAAEVGPLVSKIDGLQWFDLYRTDDRAYVLLLTQWVDDVAWSKAQWDDDVQKAVVARFSSARRVHSKLYRHVVRVEQSAHAAPPPDAAAS